MKNTKKILLLSLLILGGCNDSTSTSSFVESTSSSSKPMLHPYIKAYRQLLYSDYQSGSLKLEMNEKGTSTTVKLLNYEYASNGLLVTFDNTPLEDYSSPFLLKNENDKTQIYYDSYFTNVPSEDTSETTMPELDISDFEKELVINDGYLSVTYDLTYFMMMLEGAMPSDTSNEEQVLYTVNFYFSNDKVYQLKMDIPLEDFNMEGIEISENASLTLYADITKYSFDEKIQIPSYFNSYMYLEYEAFMENLMDKFIGSTEEYTLYPSKYEYSMKVGEEIPKINGYLKSSNEEIIRDITLEVDTSNVDVNTVGSYQVKLSTTYKNQYYEAYTTLLVLDSDLAPISTKEFTKNVSKILKANNNLIIVEDKTIHKFNTQTNSIEKSLTLKGVGQFVEYKDNYLYVTSRISNTSGTVSKIDFLNFELEREMDVDYFPYDILIDKYNDIYVTKGEDQHVKLAKINFENGTSSETLFNTYEKDHLIYDEANEAIIVVASKHTSAPTVLNYDIEEASYKKNNDLRIEFGMTSNKDIYKDKYVFDKNCYYEYDNFNFNRISLNLDDHLIFNCRLISADIDGDYLYQIHSTNIDDNNRVYNTTIAKHNLSNQEVNSFKLCTYTTSIPNIIDNYSQINVVNENIYLLNIETNTLEVYDF